MNNKVIHTVEVRPGEHETLTEEQINNCDGNIETASFLHCLGGALRGEHVDSKYLKTNPTEKK